MRVGDVLIARPLPVLCHKDEDMADMGLKSAAGLEALNVLFKQNVRVNQMITNNKQGSFGLFCYRVLKSYLIFVGLRIYWLNSSLMKLFSKHFMQPKGLDVISFYYFES